MASRDFKKQKLVSACLDFNFYDRMLCMPGCSAHLCVPSVSDGNSMLKPKCCNVLRPMAPLRNNCTAVAPKPRLRIVEEQHTPKTARPGEPHNHWTQVGCHVKNVDAHVGCSIGGAPSSKVWVSTLFVSSYRAHTWPMS